MAVLLSKGMYRSPGVFQERNNSRRVLYTNEFSRQPEALLYRFSLCPGKIASPFLNSFEELLNSHCCRPGLDRSLLASGYRVLSILPHRCIVGPMKGQNGHKA